RSGNYCWGNQFNYQIIPEAKFFLFKNTDLNILKLSPPTALSNFLIGLVLILTIIYSFSGIFFGLDFTDSFYHLNQALNPVDGIYLYPFFLSSVIIKGFIELAGSDIIYLRIINWFLLVTSMILPFIFIKVKCKR